MRSYENELKSLQEYKTQIDIVDKLGRGVFEKPISVKRQRVKKNKENKTNKTQKNQYPRLGEDYQAVLPELGELCEEREDQLVCIEKWPHFHEHDVR